MKTHYLIPLLYCLSFGVSHGQTFASTETKTTLLELYTSQGCSSCPPAERWISKLKNKKTLWKEVVPLAFHVDYWDYLGWKDSYATKKNSLRQRDYYQQRKTTAVYTPGFVSGGKQWTGWRRLEPQKSSIKAGVLQATVQGNKISGSYSHFKPKQKLNIAVLGFGIVTPIHAGENEGKKLPQDFVVLHHQKVNAQDGGWKAILPAYKKPEIKRYALAVWVQEGNALSPLQATGGWLP